MLANWIFLVAMEMELDASDQCNRSLSSNKNPSSSSSFRLRSPSLNSLRLRRIFDLLDKNSDNMIAIDELGQALGLLGLDAGLSELQSMVQTYIEPGNTGLRFEDFEALHRSLNDVLFGLDDENTDEESDLTEAFKVFDEDGDGYISAKELQVVLGKLGLQEGMEIERVEKMISSVDRNHDGRVDFFEFKDMMRSVMIPS